MKNAFRLICTLAVLIMVLSGCQSMKPNIARGTYQVVVTELRFIESRDLNSVTERFSLTDFKEFNAEGDPIYAADFHPSWVVKLKIIKKLSETETPVQEGKEYAILIHSPIQSLALSLDDAVGETTTLDFTFTEESEGIFSLFLNVFTDESDESAMKAIEEVIGQLKSKREYLDN